MSSLVTPFIAASSKDQSSNKLLVKQTGPILKEKKKKKTQQIGLQVDSKILLTKYFTISC